MNPSFGQQANYSGGVFILPDVVSSLSLKDKVHFLADPEFIPKATRDWTCDSGTITAGGLYESNKASGSSKVSCHLRHNNVTYLPGQVTLNHHDFQLDQQGAVQSGTIELPDFAPPLPLRADMFGNGAQQLAMKVQIKMDGEEKVTEDEWKTFSLFDYYSHQAIPSLEYTTPHPILESLSTDWALATERNPDFNPASAQLRTSKNYKKTSDDSRTFYLHSLAPPASRKKLYAGLQDRHGWWHFFTEQTNTFEVAVLPFNTPQLTMSTEPVLRFGFDNDSVPYDYEMNFDTYEYYQVSVKGGFKFCTVKGEDEPTEKEPRKSIVRFERDIPADSVCSVTGIILTKDQPNVIFDSELLRIPVFSSLSDLKVARKPDNDSVIISVHRLSNLEINKLSEAQRELLFEGYAKNLLLEFYDEDGNRITKVFGFIPKNQSRHRDTLIF
ncbi:hypothetical protein [Pseudomonas urmiensis]|uniref:Uncharacterized protein n=1 Tax=Pseudomonas urmiensis TaxID=2745493 RepID=A0A923G6Q6_9PSED|nr:hypothetical protein [Pseudomonas urmiensis]MBV4537284.1 hypothetical protein [Pseudomonas urmiensis]